MTVPIIEEPPPPELVVPAARELSRFGWIWTALGAALIVAARATGSTDSLDGGELALILALLGLSLACVLGAMLLARRTGPEILYYRILDKAPPLPPQVPRETGGATMRRVLPPALALALALLFAGALGAATILLFGGQPRDEIAEDVPAGALIVAGGWTLACGLVALQVSAYFARWQRLRGTHVVCRPFKAGTMRPVYWADRI